MKKIFVFGILTVTVLFWATMGTSADLFVEQFVPKEESDAVEGYWTLERMKNAKPSPMPVKKGDPIPYFKDKTQLDTGTPGRASSGDSKKVLSTEGSIPEGTSLLLTDHQLDSLLYARSVEPLANGYDVYPPPSNDVYVWLALYGNYPWHFNRFPFSAIGKVFFTKGYYNYVCSGSVAWNRAVLTAGHCLCDGSGHWHTNWIFVPAYKSGYRPYGSWYSFWKITFSSFFNSHDYGRDVGFAAVSDKAGYRIDQRTGHLGFAWNWSRYQLWNMFGYPAASPYTGKYLVQTQASYAGRDCSVSPCTTAIGSRQTGGCSGGPWIVIYRLMVSGSCNYANGVNSYYYTNRPRTIYSPYFDTSVYKMWYTAVRK